MHVVHVLYTHEILHTRFSMPGLLVYVHVCVCFCCMILYFLFTTGHGSVVQSANMNGKLCAFYSNIYCSTRIHHTDRLHNLHDSFMKFHTHTHTQNPHGNRIVRVRFSRQFITPAIVCCCAGCNGMDYAYTFRAVVDVGVALFVLCCCAESQPPPPNTPNIE